MYNRYLIAIATKSFDVIKSYIGEGDACSGTFKFLLF